MERRFSVKCGKCDQKFEFTVSVPGVAIPTALDAQMSLYSSTSGNAKIIEGGEKALEACDENKPYSHALTMPKPII